MTARLDRIHAGMAGATLAGLVALVLLSQQTTRQLREDVADLDLSHDVPVQTQRVAATLLDVETSQRGYLLTLEPPYLEPYRAGLARLDTELEALAADFADRPDAAPDLRRLRDLSDTRRAELARTIASADAQGPRVARMVLREDAGQARMDDIRQVLSRLDALAETTLSERHALRTATIERNERIVILLAPAVGLLAMALHALLRRDRALQKQFVLGEITFRERLEHRVKERTSELEAATQSLAMSEGRLRGIFDSAIDAIVTANDEQVIVAANPAAARMFRGSVADLIGMPLERLLPERHREAHRREVRDFGAAAEPARTMGGGRREVKGLRLDGDEFVLDAGISQIEHAGQRLYTAILRDLTQLRAAEAALSDSERLLAATFSSSSVAMAQIDPATRQYVAVNEALCRLTGYAASELLGMGPDHLNHPGDRLDAAKLGALLRGDAAYREEKRLVRKDGAVVWTEISGSVVRDADGQPVRVVGFIQDISARRQAEEALRARAARQALLVRLNDRLRGLQDEQTIVSEAAGLLVDFLHVERAGYGEADGESQTVSPGANVGRGLPALEGVHRMGDSGLLRSLRAGHTQVRDDIAHDPTLTSDERQHFSKLEVGAAIAVPLTQALQVQAVFFVHSKAARRWTPDDVALVEEVAQRVRADVERARAEAGVRRAKAKLEAALASMNDAVFIADAEGRLVEFNDAFVSVHRFHSREACFRTMPEYPQVLDILLPDGTPAPLEQWPVPRALRGESASGAEFHLRRKDTGEAWVGSYSFAPIRGEDGSVVGAVVNGRDVTLTKQTQADLAAAHTALRHLMANQQRVQEDERKRIARELHDDLQQSLAAIRMDAVAVGERLAKGQDNVVELLNRIDRLAAAAIASTRRIVSDLRPEMLEELGLVPALEALCAQHAQRTGSQCRLEASPALAAQLDGPVLSIGLYRITQEALNNVAKHAKASAVKVCLDCTPSGLVLLRIADNGVGMRPRDERDATGFGLLGMAERVRALGGHLRIDAQAGQGTMIEALVPNLDPGLAPGRATGGAMPSAPPDRHDDPAGAGLKDLLGHPLQTVIDALDGNVAVLDGRGVIQLLNRSWRAFATGQGDPALRGCGCGVSYLEVCRRSAATDASVLPVLRGLSAVLEGFAEAFVTEYPCAMPQGVQWFRMHAASITGGWTIVTHTEINAPGAHAASDDVAPDTTES